LVIRSSTILTKIKIVSNSSKKQLQKRVTHLPLGGNIDGGKESRRYHRARWNKPVGE